MLFIGAFCASFAFATGIILNWVKLEPIAYQLADSSSPSESTAAVTEVARKPGRGIQLTVDGSDRALAESDARAVIELVQAQLRDPSSAQIRELARKSDGRFCGQVNAKNDLGEYVGFRHFMIDLHSMEALIAPDIAATARARGARTASAEDATRDLAAIKAVSDACFGRAGN